MFNSFVLSSLFVFCYVLCIYVFHFFTKWPINYYTIVEYNTVIENDHSIIMISFHVIDKLSYLRLVTLHNCVRYYCYLFLYAWYYRTIPSYPTDI